MDKRYGHDIDDFDFEAVKKRHQKLSRVRTNPAREPRPVNDDARRPARIKRRIRVLTIKGYSTDEIWERVNRISMVSKVVVSAIRTDTRATMKVLDELGHLKNVTL